MYEALLRKAGLKITSPRLRILAILHIPHHWDVESIYEALKKEGGELGLATIYRVLTQFEACGLIKRHFFEHEVSVFELNRPDHHDHLVCVKCRRIEEFVDQVIEQHQKNIADRFGFEMHDHRLVIYGRCSTCR